MQAIRGGDAASDMDRIYRLQRHIYDASRKFYLLGRDDMLAGLDVPRGGTILEVGCGTGRNLILAARRYPHARLYGFDVSPAMLETAAASIAKAGLSDRITLAQGDASNFTGFALFGVSSFDRVFISYALSMIPPWREAVARAFAAIVPGGSLHIVDFGEQSRLPRAFRKGLRAWLKKFSVYPREDLERELEALAQRSGAKLTLTRPFRDYARSAVVRKGR
jgi:S-adenosylmethionine-diacylgycerolhomoserine-N-methlytransferase